MYREGTGHDEQGKGSGWVGGLGKMKIVSVGPQVSDNCFILTLSIC